MKINNINSKIQIGGLIVALMGIFLIIIFRSAGLFAIVPDEYIYSRFSRLLPLANSIIPGYLYLAIYRGTNFCGANFLGCARVLNGLFFVGAAPFIYMTARRVCNRYIALFVVGLVLLGPINSYTVYYMPETPYFFTFWLGTWFILGLNASSIDLAWAVAGIIVGMSALIKPHALFLLPPIAIYICFVSVRVQLKSKSLALGNVAIFVASVFVVKLSVGYLIAGAHGINVFGSLYGSIATSTGSYLSRYISIILLSCESAKGHISAICLIYGLPVAVALRQIYCVAFSKADAPENTKIAVYATAVLVVLVSVTALFTASIADTSPDQTITRLHMRYYNFALPLLTLIAASQVSKKTEWMLRSRMLAATPVSLVILYAIFTHNAPFTPTYVDSPELRGLTFESAALYTLGGLSLLCLILWVLADRVGSRIFVFLFLPVAVGVSSLEINQELQRFATADSFDKAAIFTKQMLSERDISNLVVVGSDPSGLTLALLYLDNANAVKKLVSQGGDLDFKKLPAGKEWVLLVGDYALPNSTCYRLRMRGFTLARLSCPNILDFSSQNWAGVIDSARGLAAAESWGAWSLNKVVKLEFAKPLPEQFTLHLVARAFGPNIGKEFVAHVGDDAVKFTLEGSPSEKELILHNPERLSVLSIDVPSPISPKALGISPDERMLGIGLTKLWVSAF